MTYYEIAASILRVRNSYSPAWNLRRALDEVSQGVAWEIVSDQERADFLKACGVDC